MASSSSAWSSMGGVGGGGPAMSYSTTSNEEGADNFSRYSKFLVKNSNGVDGMGGKSNPSETEREPIVWVDTLGDETCSEYQFESSPPSSSPTTSPPPPPPFSILSWNILAQSLYESQYQRRRIQKVALAQLQPQLPPSLSTSSSHPHPWPKRVKRIIEILIHSNSDIICLQECELLTFKNDLIPALSKVGYDGIAQEDDRGPDIMPTFIKEATKHRDARNHIAATFWKRNKFEPVGEASVRTRSLTTVLRLKKQVGSNVDNTGEKDDVTTTSSSSNCTPTPTVAVVNVHLEGHPRRFSERTHQLQHAMMDLAKRIEHEKKEEAKEDNDDDDDDDIATAKTRTKTTTHIGKLNALVLAGDFNCELQSSACSTYLRMGRLGRQAGLGGIHGEDSLVLPPSLLETTEATEVIAPIMEWGRALPEDKVADVGAHPFRRNGMTSAYPPWLGKDDARSHFTFCSELSKRPVPGLDQLWFSSMTLERKGLRRMFVDDAGLWERYFYDDSEVEKRREEERRKVLASGLPSMECKYPSDHLPIGAIFDWKSDGCDHEEEAAGNDASAASNGEVRGLNIVDSDGNNIQDDALQEQKKKATKKQSFETPHEELDYLLHSCPYDSEEQQSDVQFILSPLDPPLSVTSKDRPTPDQMEQLEVRRIKKAKLLTNASLGVRPWLKQFWKVSKQVGKWDRQRQIQIEREIEKARQVDDGEC
ncbi:hypothetical protein ACHAXR_003477 [Thalassiosira sp. AJA248-18]